MTDSRSPRPLLLPPPAPELARIWRGYQHSLSSMSPDQLLSHLTQINAAMEADRQARMNSLLASRSDHLSSLDQPVLSSTGTATRPSPMDRAAPPSPFPRPSAVDLLAASQRLGPKLAQRLLVASARAQARKEVP